MAPLKTGAKAPITLKTLPHATAQEVFDQVANHLLTQNKKSINDDVDDYTCMYRNPKGLKCAAGCLIGDHEYNSNMEHKSWKQLVEEGVIPANKHTPLICELQHIHDFTNVEGWKVSLNKVAKQYSLNT